MILKAAGWISAAILGVVVLCAGVLAAPFLGNPGDDTRAACQLVNPTGTPAPTDRPTPPATDSGDPTGGCAAIVSAAGWTQPVHGTVGSGFRTPDRPGHNGVDLIVARATPIHAAHDGVVTTVRCDAVDTRTDTNWGCDRDGDPNLTAGCGWYVDIEHAGNIITRYCHQLVHPYVTEGQHVSAGQLLGILR